ncbi:uncharacterized protein N7500_003182 [Penicillium coprophilum]|uniref:uncharacterized protein n=1 Tax=Penicillium coprophilum TaxID=36646 RepID=UPI002390F68F|nr:uncharacterized protein N7500_003182 [Penicillium coprophilum]KAJ5170399.1 hypothetical protein N7500_003182 [Penicillium coprophilum]
MFSTDAMSSPSPKKKPDHLGDFTAGEMKLIMASVLCTPGKLDTNKLGKLTNMKRNSAASRFPSVKRKLEKMFEAQLNTLDEQNNTPVDDNSLPKSRAKKRRDKVTEPQPEAEVENKTNAGSGESFDFPVKMEIKAKPEDDIEDLWKFNADLMDIKPEPVD